MHIYRGIVWNLHYIGVDKLLGYIVRFIHSEKEVADWSFYQDSKAI